MCVLDGFPLRRHHAPDPNNVDEQCSSAKSPPLPEGRTTVFLLVAKQGRG